RLTNFVPTKPQDVSQVNEEINEGDDADPVEQSTRHIAARVADLGGDEGGIVPAAVGVQNEDQGQSVPTQFSRLQAHGPVGCTGFHHIKTTPQNGLKTNYFGHRQNILGSFSQCHAEQVE